MESNQCKRLPAAKFQYQSSADAVCLCGSCVEQPWKFPMGRNQSLRHKVEVLGALDMAHI